MRFAGQSPRYFPRYDFQTILCSGSRDGKTIHIRVSALCAVCRFPLILFALQASLASMDASIPQGQAQSGP
jgi:hypothetical protein